MTNILKEVQKKDYRSIKGPKSPWFEILPTQTRTTNFKKLIFDRKLGVVVLKIDFRRCVQFFAKIIVSISCLDMIKIDRNHIVLCQFECLRLTRIDTIVQRQFESRHTFKIISSS